MENPLTLESLLAQITEDNLHEEADTGPAVGDEAGELTDLTGFHPLQGYLVEPPDIFDCRDKGCHNENQTCPSRFPGINLVTTLRVVTRFMLHTSFSTHLPQ